MILHTATKWRSTTLKRWRKYGLRRKFKFTTSTIFEHYSSFQNEKDWEWWAYGLENGIFRPDVNTLREYTEAMEGFYAD